jgi:pyruvate carboxylase
MGGLLKPLAAHELIKTLKEEISIPVHLHTHDTSGNGVASILYAAAAGVDIADAALSSMSGLTSQPSLNSLVAALEFNERASSLSSDYLEELSDYFEKLRPVYESFESGIKTNTTLIYKYEVPGGQYSNLKAQVDSFGMGHRYNEVLEKYKEANELFGDIIKVTPSSKVVGDMAIFMLQNGLNKENIYARGLELAFPESVIEFYKGLIGQPEFGFDEELRKVVLKGASYIDVRPGLMLEDFNFDEVAQYYKDKYSYELSENTATSAAIYPKVYEEYIQFLREYGDFIDMDTDVFFFGLNEGESFDYEHGLYPTKHIRLVSIGLINSEGFRPFTFEVNGFRREILIEDKQAIMSQILKEIKVADENNPAHIGSPIPGSIVKVMAKPGDTVTKGQAVAIVEAMKMETEILARADGVVDFVYIEPAQSVKAQELVMELKL